MRTRAELEQFVKRKASLMRAYPTQAELRLWELLQPLGGWEFQSPLLILKKRSSTGFYCYILDFYHSQANLIVEVDGTSHRLKKGRDSRRDDRARVALGAVTLRLTNSDVMSRPQWCLAQIEAAIGVVTDGRKIKVVEADST